LSNSKIEIQNFLNPNFELELNFEPAGRSKFKISKNPNFDLELNFEPARRSKFKIFKTRISWWSWISSQLEDRNSKFSKPVFLAGVIFRARSNIEILNFQNPNLELELNFEQARKSKIFKTRIFRWFRASSKIEIQNFQNAEFRAGVEFWVSSKIEIQV
jgi:hypothetical protein